MLVALGVLAGCGDDGDSASSDDDRCSDEAVLETVAAGGDASSCVPGQ